jgi:glycerol-3-phosphate dehydrogenase
MAFYYLCSLTHCFRADAGSICVKGGKATNLLNLANWIGFIMVLEAFQHETSKKPCCINTLPLSFG